MKNVEATFDEARDGFQPVAEGTYPAHCSSFGVNDWKDSKIFNLEFTIADEAQSLTVSKLRVLAMEDLYKKLMEMEFL